MRARLTSTHFVGRVGELAELELACREAAAGRPVVVLLGGDSGVGKTRLVGELEHRLASGAESEAALVLRGEGVEQGETELPYAPLVSALRPLVRSRHPALQALSAGGRSQLAALLPGLHDGVPAPESPEHDGSGQLRLFEALLELLDVLGEAQPLVLILEDMHWADRSTRTFVAFLARSLRQERVALVLTYRTDELHRRHPLRPLLSELERLERARRVEIAPFDRLELTEALSDILGDRPTPELVERLFARSEGNALYTEELLAAGLDGLGAPPQSLHDAFMLRIERLSGDAQRAARTVAVGRRLNQVTIEHVTEIGHEQLQAALREAVAEQVLVAGDDGRLLFRHALLREALYDDLLPGERGEIHLALARELEQDADGPHDGAVQRAATIASHYASAGDQPAALRASVNAALAARDVHAYGEAADLAERALELWPRVPDGAELSALDHVDLLLLAAEGHGIAGDRARAEVLLQSALDRLDEQADCRRYAIVLGRLARIQWTLNRGAEGVQSAQRALGMLPDGERTRERASLMSWLARTRFLRGRFREALTDSEAALAAARVAGDTGVETEILNTLGMVEVALGHVPEGVTRLRRAMEIARAGGDIDGLGYVYTNLADLLNLRGRTEEGLATAREGLAAIPRRFTQTHTWAMLTVSELALENGDWDDARAKLETSGSQPVGVMLIFRLLREADLALAVGDDQLAQERLSRAGPLVAASSEPQWIGALGGMLGESRRRGRDLLGARRAVAEALDRLELCTDDVMRIARVTATGLRIEADIAQRARDLKEPGEARDAVARARIHVQRLRAAAQEGGPVEAAWQAYGVAELARARGRSDPALWLKAGQQWEAMSRPYHDAISKWRAAEAQVESGDRVAAAETARAGLKIARGLGSRWLTEEIETLCERARLDGAPVRAGGTPTPAGDSGPAPEDPFGLTPRERQVLTLIAEGATNRQIGNALFMAEKTASVHVSRILSKLGVRSRTQAAAVAHRLRLNA